MLVKSGEWARRYPGAMVGMLAVRGVANCAGHQGLQAAKDRIVSELRARFPSADALKADPVLQAYRAYYRLFGKSYHVAAQLESVALKGRSLPSVNGLVDAMFAAELKNRLLTAGHDLAVLSPPFTVGAAAGGERYTTMRGEEKEPKAVDMMISDSAGVLSCILHGPDQRSRITADTRSAVYFVYAPAGVGEDPARAHLEDIRSLVLLLCPEADPQEVELVIA
jgi:DNA/RNA-binding domain of Phe-tRNA-synthetase-like protein